LHILVRRPGDVIRGGSITRGQLARISEKELADGEMLASTRMGFSSAGYILLAIAHSRVRTGATVVAASVSLLTRQSSCGYCQPLRRRPRLLPGVAAVADWSDRKHRR